MAKITIANVTLKMFIIDRTIFRICNENNPLNIHFASGSSLKCITLINKAMKISVESPSHIYYVACT